MPWRDNGVCCVLCGIVCFVYEVYVCVVRREVGVSAGTKNLVTGRGKESGRSVVVPGVKREECGTLSNT